MKHLFESYCKPFLCRCKRSVFDVESTFTYWLMLLTTECKCNIHKCIKVLIGELVQTKNFNISDSQIKVWAKFSCLKKLVYNIYNTGVLYPAFSFQCSIVCFFLTGFEHWFLRYIPVDRRDENDQSTHKWMVYVRGPKGEPNVDHFVKKVWFFLHPSYRPNDLVEVS